MTVSGDLRWKKKCNCKPVMRVLSFRNSFGPLFCTLCDISCLIQPTFAPLITKEARRKKEELKIRIDWKLAAGSKSGPLLLFPRSANVLGSPKIRPGHERKYCFGDQERSKMCVGTRLVRDFSDQDLIILTLSRQTVHTFFYRRAVKNVRAFQVSAKWEIGLTHFFDREPFQISDKGNPFQTS